MALFCQTLNSWLDAHGNQRRPLGRSYRLRKALRPGGLLLRTSGARKQNADALTAVMNRMFGSWGRRRGWSGGAGGAGFGLGRRCILF